MTRARRPRLLIVGCGDVGVRVVKALPRHWRVFALTSSMHRIQALRDLGVTPLLGDLDQASTLGRIAALAPRVIHLAPPAAEGAVDDRTRRLLQALARAGVVQRLVYASTTGVYGDAGGQWVPEWRSVAPQTLRAQRRVDAECRLRRFGRVHCVAINVLRVPGIYALDREGGNPVERVRRAAPVLSREDDVYTNHIHADDLARACIAALLRGAPQRVYNVCDDDRLPMGDYMDSVADLAGLPRPPRLSMIQARQTLSPMTLSFWSESRRIDNHRMKTELRVKLRHATHVTGLKG